MTIVESILVLCAVFVILALVAVLTLWHNYRQVPIIGRVYVSRQANENPFRPVAPYDYVVPRTITREWVLVEVEYVNPDGSRYCSIVDPISMRIDAFNALYRLAKGTH